MEVEWRVCTGMEKCGRKGLGGCESGGAARGDGGREEEVWLRCLPLASLEHKMYSDRVLESDEAKPPIDGMSGQYLLGTPTMDFKVFQ